LKLLYEYGLVAFIYLSAYLYLLWDNFKNIIEKNADKLLKLASGINLSLTIFIMIYFYTSILRIPVAITLFSILGLLEGLKFAVKNSKKNEI